MTPDDCEPYKTILKTPPPGYDRTNVLAFIFDPESTYANPYVLCQKWTSNGSFEWVQIPVVSVIDDA
jgi:hypothetical protein